MLRLEVKVNHDLCISCGLCVSSCPEVFAWDEDEKAKALEKPIDDDLGDCIMDAADGCPTDAIETN